jgi:hypothetical protein
VRETLLAGTVTVAAVISPAAASAQAAVDLPSLLSRVGGQIERYYERAQSLLCHESVMLQPVGGDRFPNGPSRRLEYELRVEWQSSLDGQPTSATVHRELLKVNGRAPRKRDPRDECLDPKPVSLDPLVMLLPSRQPEFSFSIRGADQIDGREAVTIDYAPRTPGPPVVAWSGNCGTVDVPALVRGRLWVDAVTGDVLRLDERLAGTFDIRLPEAKTRHGGELYWTLERADTSIRFKPVQFAEPEETLVLPATIDSYTVIRNSGVPRLRVSQTFSECRRFMTGARIVP